MKKIGVLMDGFHLNKWQAELMTFIQSHPGLTLEVFIINEKPKLPKREKKRVYRLSQFLDRKLFTVKNKVYVSGATAQFSDVHQLSINGHYKGIGYYFTDEQVEKVKEMQLDVLIRFGFGILKGKVLSAAKEGVWSLHHGDNRINRGGPPGFWEVVNKESRTGITLQKLTENLDGGTVIDRCFIKTNATSFTRNNNEAQWAGFELYRIALNKLAKRELKASSEGQKNYYHPLYRNPSDMKMLGILVQFYLRRLLELAKNKFNKPQWFLLYKFRSKKKSEKSFFRYKKIELPKGVDWADPFVVKIQNKFYVFMEELFHNTKKGHISYLEFDSDGKRTDQKPKPIIEEDYHLSYPFVFENDDKFYLMPEAAQSGELWIYACTGFPDKWEKKYCVFSDKAFYDGTLIYHKGLWYLFGTERLSCGGSTDQYLHIYYCEDFKSGKWYSHPLNPVTQTVVGSRPAGMIFRQEGKLIRPSQIGAPKYGYGIQFTEIEKLSPTEFKETKSDQILPYWDNRILATHTYNFTDGFSIIDAQGY